MIDQAALFDHGPSILGMEAEERIERIWKPCWVNYLAGRIGLKRLARLVAYPRTVRPPCCLVVGDPNNGKTTLVQRFARQFNPPESELAESRRLPVVYTQSPDMADPAGLYINILRSINAPYVVSSQPNKLQDQVLKSLTKLGTRVLVIDELHNILDGRVDKRGVFLNVLKHLSNELQIPLVGVGTREVLLAIQSDQQLGSRFKPFLLPRWEPRQAYAKFIGQLFDSRGLDKGAYAELVRTPEFIRSVHSLTEGLTGETWEVVCMIVEQMEESGQSVLSENIVNQIDWTRPRDRRQVAGDGAT